MELVVLTSSSSSTNIPFSKAGKLYTGGGLSSKNPNNCLVFANGCSFSYLAFSSQKLKTSSITVAAKKNNSSNSKKVDTHSFVSKPDESTSIFPEAVLLKDGRKFKHQITAGIEYYLDRMIWVFTFADVQEHPRKQLLEICPMKKVQEDGRLLPEFADAEEQELYEALNLLLESDLDEERMSHYEVVYLIHENHVQEVEKVNLKVQEFLMEKKGKVWRFSDWGLRRLAYKIQKAKNAHYILMNFELEAKYINEFKSMLDKDERVIRHLVIKRDEAITEDCPPPPEFHTMRAGTDDDEDDDLDLDDDYEDAENETEVASLDDGREEGIIYVDEDEADNRKIINFSTRRRKLNTEKVGR